MKSTNTAFAEALAEMMKNWDATMEKAKVRYPSASDDELYEITKNAMNASLGIK